MLASMIALSLISLFSGDELIGTANIIKHGKDNFMFLFLVQNTNNLLKNKEQWSNTCMSQINKKSLSPKERLKVIKQLLSKCIRHC